VKRESIGVVKDFGGVTGFARGAVKLLEDSVQIIAFVTCRLRMLLHGDIVSLST
jgi:hypothetical protein